MLYGALKGLSLVKGVSQSGEGTSGTVVSQEGFLSILRRAGKAKRSCIVMLFLATTIQR